MRKIKSLSITYYNNLNVSSVYESRSKNSKLHLEKRAKAKIFCCSNILLLHIKLEKLIQSFLCVLQFLCRWGSYKDDKSRSEQNRGPRSHKISPKEQYDTQGNPWGHDTDICWGLPYLYHCEIQAGQEQLRKWPSIRLFKNFNHWWSSWWYSPFWMTDILLSSR